MKISKSNAGFADRMNSLILIIEIYLKNNTINHAFFIVEKKYNKARLDINEKYDRKLKPVDVKIKIL